MIRITRDYIRMLTSRQEGIIVLKMWKINCIFLLYIMAGMLILFIIRLNEELRRISP